MGYGYLVIPHIFYPQLNALYRFDEARFLEDIGVTDLQDPIEEPFTVCECPCDIHTLINATSYLLMCGIPFIAESVDSSGDSSVTVYHKFCKTDCIVESKEGKQYSIRNLFPPTLITHINKAIDLDLYKKYITTALAIFKLTNSFEAVREHYEMHSIQ